MNRCTPLSLRLQKVAWLKFRVGKDQYGLEYLGKAIEREETRLNLKGKLCTGRWLPRSILCPLVPRPVPGRKFSIWPPRPVAEPGGRFPMKWRETQCQWVQTRNAMLLPKFLGMPISDASFTVQRCWILCHHSNQPHLKNPLVLAILECFPDQDISYAHSQPHTTHTEYLKSQFLLF